LSLSLLSSAFDALKQVLITSQALFMARRDLDPWILQLDAILLLRGSADSSGVCDRAALQQYRGSAKTARVALQYPRIEIPSCHEESLRCDERLL
jgi:hypothetical protein